MFRGKRLSELVQVYRKTGYIFLTPHERAAGLFSDDVLMQLQRACCATIMQRGANFVPQQDDQHKQRLDMQTKLAAVGGPPPPQGQHVNESEFKVEPKAKLKKKSFRMRMRLRNQREVDEAYDKVTAARRMAAQDGRAAASMSASLEEAEKKLESGQTTEAEVLKSFDAKTATESFEAYRSSGRLDKDIRKQHHLNEVYRYVENTVQSWNRTWPGSPALQHLLVGAESTNKSNDSGKVKMAASVGDSLGELCGNLSGSVVLRLYDDSILRLPFLSNSLPIHFHGAFTSYRDPRGLDALIALPHHTNTHAPASVVVYPGSHHVINELTSCGQDIAPFQKTSLWDVGDAVRPFASLARSAQPVVLRMEPGSVLIANNMLLRSCLPTMDGEVGSPASWVTPAQLGEGPASANAQHVDRCPLLYMVQLMPDGATFDGGRQSWMAKDSHGPLYKYAKGERIRDEAQFPILHNELNVE